MKLHTESSGGTNRITAYGQEFIAVNKVNYRGAVVVLPKHLITPWRPRHVAELTREDLAVVLPYRPEIVLLGTGRLQVFPPAGLFADLIEARIGFEIMTTQAACRTGNILLSEGREAAAMLLPPTA